MTASQPDSKTATWGGGTQLRARLPHRIAVRLTGRGGVLVVFVFSFAGAFAASGSHIGVLAGASYVAACIFAASAVRRTGLLPVVVAPPMLFAGALVCVQIITAEGGVLSITEGTLVALGNVAPWLFTGTVLGIIIALVRGLAQNVRDLRQGLLGEPAGPAQRGSEPPQP